MCNSCNIKIGETSELIFGVSGIPLKGVMNDSFASLLPWAWCINEDKVKAAFKDQAGLDITETDMVTLVKANLSGNDVKVHRVNFKDLIKGIRFTQEERDNASCKIMLTR